MIRYGSPRRTHNGSAREDILSRERGPSLDRYVGRIMCAFPGFAIEWACPQDMRDPRRFYITDLDGKLLGHATPREIARTILAPMLPAYSGRY